MTKSAKDKWNKLYDREGYFYDKDPIDFLRDHWKRLRKGKVLDLAMGEGRNAVFLAQHDFEVIGFDVADVAIEKAKQLAYMKDVKIETKVADLDLYVFPMFTYDTIILSYFKPLSRYYSEIFRSLVQGGTVLIESYTINQLARDPIEGFDNKDYFKPNALLRNLNEFQILYYNEETINGKSVVQCIARKPLDRDAVKYGFAKGDPTDETTGRFRAAEDLFKKK